MSRKQAPQSRAEKQLFRLRNALLDHCDALIEMLGHMDKNRPVLARKTLKMTSSHLRKLLQRQLLEAAAQDTTKRRKRA